MRSRLVVPIALAVAVGAIAVARVLGGVGDAGPSCAAPVDWREAARHAGRAAAVSGPVADVTYAPDVGGEPTFVNLGNPHPDPDRFDVVIYAAAREGFEVPPEEGLPGETICVVGDVRLRDGVPQVIVDTHLSLVVVD
jgi:hypothetical protein